MNYSRSFYDQDGSFVADLFYSDLGERSATLGLSGDSVVSLDISEGVVFWDGKCLASLDELNSFNLRIVGNNENVTAWYQDIPIFSSGGAFSFDTIFCNSDFDFSFSDSIYGVQPDLEVEFSGWDNGLGYAFLGNGGDHTLEINDAVFFDSYFYVNSFPGSISAGGSGVIEFISESSVGSSGTGILNLLTNAGEYNLPFFLEKPSSLDAASLEIFFDGELTSPSSTVNFYINNRFGPELLVELFLDNQLESGSLISGWRMFYYDVDRGLEDFYDLNRYDADGFGETGVSYRIPTSGTTSGYLEYTNTGVAVLSQAALRVTNFSSIEYQAFIDAL